MSIGEITKTFEGAEAFEAYSKAVAWCRENDVAMGSMQRDEPIGLCWGERDHFIPKWRNMSKEEQGQMDGLLTGDKRHGPVTIRIKRRAA